MTLIAEAFFSDKGLFLLLAILACLSVQVRELSSQPLPTNQLQMHTQTSGVKEIKPEQKKGESSTSTLFEKFKPKEVILDDQSVDFPVDI